MLSLEAAAYPPIASRENTPVPVRVTRVRDVTSAGPKCSETSRLFYFLEKMVEAGGVETISALNQTFALVRNTMPSNA